MRNTKLLVFAIISSFKSSLPCYFLLFLIYFTFFAHLRNTKLLLLAAFCVNYVQSKKKLLPLAVVRNGLVRFFFLVLYLWSRLNINVNYHKKIFCNNQRFYRDFLMKLKEYSESKWFCACKRVKSIYFKNQSQILFSFVPQLLSILIDIFFVNLTWLVATVRKCQKQIFIYSVWVVVYSYCEAGDSVKLYF